MEKGTAHYPLWRVRQFIDSRRVTMTRPARDGAVALGLNMARVFEVIKALQQADFHKSMTTYDDHTVWQDVYRPITPAGAVYLKLTVSEGLLVVSFKAL